MSTLQQISPDSIITGWDFSTSGVKCLAFDLDGKTIADVRLPTDLWTADGVSELSIFQLEGQARASVRMMADRLKSLGRLKDWIAGGISATHHTAGRIDAQDAQVRRMICWNDETLAEHHAQGLKRLGGQDKVRELIGGPWAIRYSLSHLVKDESTLSETDWKRTAKIVQHGALAAGFLTDNFGVVSQSAAASTGIMDLRTGQWRREMLDALADPRHRELVWGQLPRIIDANEPIGPLSASLTREAGISPLIFPTSDDQQAGLIGGGAVDSGQVAVILGTSAVVNGSSSQLPTTGQLDVMKLNWGPFLWMRCWMNGAGAVNQVVGSHPDWPALEEQARRIAPGCNGTSLTPFLSPEPSLGVVDKCFKWNPEPPADMGAKFRAALEALAYLIAVGVREHEESGQTISRITVSGGLARSRLMCEILASVLNRPLELLVSDEGPALGAAVTALAALENFRRRSVQNADVFPIAGAVERMVRFQAPVAANANWTAAYDKGLKDFRNRIVKIRKGG
ncbi:MAG: FGGY-family carbohydrate kinase [Planctomycetota bacterium]